ncbi:MAG: cation:proton antiporter [Methanolinea sp.]|jgi:CPA2 family monovalent cation:H+ antiporter-2|nr:cation:proton antiporter [Methanolinea sp.]
MQGIVLALSVCLVLALITKKLSLPSIPFYIIAGLLLGQSGLSLVGIDEVSLFLTHLGLLFLLFFLGLEIKPGRIWSNQTAILKSGLLDLHINVAIGFLAAFALGFPLFDALIVAAAFFISSTAMAVTSLVENRKLLMREAETVVWLMVFEDIVVILLLAFIGTSSEHPLIVLAKILVILSVILAVTKIGKDYIISILKRDDELPVLLTFSAVLGIAGLAGAWGVPESFMVIAFGTILGTIDPVPFEIHSRPFKDVFLVVFFVFFGITTDLFASGVSWIAIVCISILAVLSKFASGLAIGKYIHRSRASGVEIWSNTTGRGEFSIAIAAVYGSAVVSSTVAAMVIVTSIVGAFAAKYSANLKKILVKPVERRMSGEVPGAVKAGEEGRGG